MKIEGSPLFQNILSDLKNFRTFFYVSSYFYKGMKGMSLIANDVVIRDYKHVYIRGKKCYCRKQIAHINI